VNEEKVRCTDRDIHSADRYLAACPPAVSGQCCGELVERDGLLEG